MSSKHVNSNNKNISSDNTNQQSASCAVAHHLTLSSHHVRHHSYDPTSNTLAAQIFPSSRLNRKENNLNNTNTNLRSHFLSTRSSSHRHTSSFASDRSSFTDLNSNSYHQHNYSTSQENLRLNSDVNPSSSTSISIKNSIPSKLSSTIPLSSSSSSSVPLTTATTTNSTITANSLTNSLSHLNNNLSSSSSSSNSSTILNHFNIHNAKLICLLLFFALLFYHGSLRYIKGATSCHRLLNEGRIERYHVWQPTGCMIHWYDLLDFNQCTRLITQSSSTIDKKCCKTIVSYILLRNIPTFLRQHYSPFFSWFGSISLELFVTQYHIWLVANGHGTLTVIPRMPTLNLIITTFIFICCCHELHRITNILTPVFVPNDCKCFIRNCLLYLFIIIVSSYMFSSV
ncbi:unnamed protein product [Rotaria sordida]|uniref:Cas1p 10 TM acyl transferase domain-containing protein n=1 Tax=Rotaria sordida TaxID=392033 RepID=A0A815FTX9_9BILA|nr:unnamed protein product [Rotaria sordida]